MRIESNLNGYIVIRRAPAGTELTWKEVDSFEDEYEIEYSFNVFRAIRKNYNSVSISYGNEKKGVIELYVPEGIGINHIELSAQALIDLDLKNQASFIEVQLSGQGSIVIRNKVDQIKGTLSGQSSLIILDADECSVSISGQSSLTTVRVSSIKANVSGQSQLTVFEGAKNVYVSLLAQSRAVLYGHVHCISGKLSSGSSLVILGEVDKMDDLYVEPGSMVN